VGSAAGLVRALRRAVPGVGQTGEVHAAKSADEDRVAVLGDSVTFGEAIATEDTFCRRTEGLLNRAQPKVMRVSSTSACPATA